MSRFYLKIRFLDKTEEFWLDPEADSLNPRHEAQQPLACRAFGGFSGRTRACHPSPSPASFSDASVAPGSFGHGPEIPDLGAEYLKKKQIWNTAKKKNFSSFSSASCYVGTTVEMKRKSEQNVLLLWNFTVLAWCFGGGGGGGGEDNRLSGLNSGLYLHECCHHKFLERLSVWQHSDPAGLLWITQLSHQHPSTSHGFRLLEDKQTNEKDSNLPPPTHPNIYLKISS